MQLKPSVEMMLPEEAPESRTRDLRLLIFPRTEARLLIKQLDNAVEQRM
jgi:hypothetical protein